MKDLSKNILSAYITKPDKEYGKKIEFEFLIALSTFQSSLNFEQIEMFEKLEYLSKQIKRLEYSRVINFRLDFLNKNINN